MLWLHARRTGPRFKLVMHPARRDSLPAPAERPWTLALPSACWAVFSLVHFHSSAVGVLHDDAAAPRHNLVLPGVRSAELPQRFSHLIERFDIEARKGIAAGVAFRCTAWGGCLVDRKVHRTQLDSQMHWAVFVQFLCQIEADRSVEVSSVPGISREQNKRCYLRHRPHYGTRTRSKLATGHEPCRHARATGGALTAVKSAGSRP